MCQGRCYKTDENGRDQMTERNEPLQQTGTKNAEKFEGTALNQERQDVENQRQKVASQADETEGAPVENKAQPWMVSCFQPKLFEVGQRQKLSRRIEELDQICERLRLDDVNDCVEDKTMREVTAEQGLGCVENEAAAECGVGQACAKDKEVVELNDEDDKGGYERQIEADELTEDRGVADLDGQLGPTVLGLFEAGYCGMGSSSNNCRRHLRI